MTGTRGKVGLDRRAGLDHVGLKVSRGNINYILCARRKSLEIFKAQSDRILSAFVKEGVHCCSGVSWWQR